MLFTKCVTIATVAKHQESDFYTEVFLPRLLILSSAITSSSVLIFIYLVGILLLCHTWEYFTCQTVATTLWWGRTGFQLGLKQSIVHRLLHAISRTIKKKNLVTSRQYPLYSCSPGIYASSARQPFCKHKIHCVITINTCTCTCINTALLILAATRLTFNMFTDKITFMFFHLLVLFFLMRKDLTKQSMDYHFSSHMS